MDSKENTIKRLYGLLDLQKKIENIFGCENYNVFIFGSYLTTDYIEGKSDIDIAIYTLDFELYKKLSLYLETYFEKLNIPSDIFYIDTNIVAPIYCAPLKSKVQFTEYYPEILESFYLKCEEALNNIREKVAV